jgi:2-isopropylmalate synthase
MVQILDSTLREGEQTPGVYFDSHIKLAIADLLSAIGVEYMEAGHPAVSPEVDEAVRQIAKRKLNIKVGAHSRSLRKDIDQAIDCGVEFLGIFYCVSNGRLNGVLKKSFSSAINQITDVIKYAKETKPDMIVRYTPEDTVRSDYQNVLAAASAAVTAGADIISVADTTGYMIPGTKRSMYDYILKLKTDLADIGLKPKMAVHCHNDRGLAVANALDGYRAGAEIIDTAVLGLGERAGIVDLAQLMVVLKNDFEVSNKWNLRLLPKMYSLINGYSNISIPVNYPVTGENVFTHCAGIHTHAAVINPVHYQSLDNQAVGREVGICLDHMAGASAVKYSLEQIGIVDVEKELLNNVLEKVKVIGQKGRIVNSEELKHIYDWCHGE